MFLRKKEDAIKQVIREQLERAEKAMVSLSWGKDSYLLLHYLLQQDPGILAVHLDSGYELPDNYAFRDLVTSTHNLNYCEVKQKYDYIEVCKQYDLPHLRSPAQQRKVISLLKKEQLDDFAKRSGVDTIFWGIRAEESKGRWGLSTQGYYIDKNNGLRFCHPLIFLTSAELWYLYEYYELPVNEIYWKTGIIPREQIRNSGWLSTDSAQYGRMNWLRKFYPEQYAKMLHYFPQAKTQSR